MPTYSYACTECDNKFDAVQAFTDDALTTCPQCSGRLRKLFNSVGVVFKGSGFYRTDSRESAKSSSASSSPTSSESGSGGASPSGTEKSGAAKSGTEKSGTEKSGTEKSGTGKSGGSSSPAPAAASSG